MHTSDNYARVFVPGKPRHLICK